MKGYSVVSHAANNVVRLRRRSLRLFLVLAASACLLTIAFIVSECCGRLISAAMGPLEGTYACALKGGGAIPGEIALRLDEGFGVVSDTLTRAEHPAYIYRNGALLTGVKRTSGDKKILFAEIDGYYNAAPFRMIGIDACETDEDFFSGAYVVTEGRELTAEDNGTRAYTALLSDEVAEANHIALGDIVGIRIPYDQQESGMETRPMLNLTVVGLFRSQIENKSAVWDYSVPQNVIYLPVQTAAEFFRLMNEDQPQLRLSLPVTTLHLRLTRDAAADNLAARLEDFFLADTSLTKVTPDSQAIAVSRIASFTYMTVAALTVVLFCLTLILCWQNRRERMSETGILCALGLKNNRISAQFFVENLLIALVALLAALALAAGAAQLFGGGVQTWLMESRMAAQIENTADSTVLTGAMPVVAAARRSGMELLSRASVLKTAALLFAAVCCGSLAAAAQTAHLDAMTLLKGAGKK